MNPETSNLDHHARLIARAESAREAAVQQARQHAQEARTQRGIVLGILRELGLPEEDYNAERLVLEHVEKLKADAAEWRKVREHLTRRDAPCEHAYDVVSLVDGLVGQVLKVGPIGVHAGEPGPRIPGCMCTHEEGDSLCPVHPTCEECGCVECECEPKTEGSDV